MKTLTHGRGHVTMKVEIEVMICQLRNTTYWWYTSRSKGQARKASPAGVRGRPGRHLDLGLLASRAMREYMSVVLSCSVCSTWSGSPRTLNTEWDQCNHRALKIWERKARESGKMWWQRQRWSEWCGARSQGIWGPLKAGKVKDTDSPLGLPEKDAALPTPSFQLHEVPFCLVISKTVG